MGHSGEYIKPTVVTLSEKEMLDNISNLMAGMATTTAYTTNIVYC